MGRGACARAVLVVRGNKGSLTALSETKNSFARKGLSGGTSEGGKIKSRHLKLLRKPDGRAVPLAGDIAASVTERVKVESRENTIRVVKSEENGEELNCLKKI